MRRPLLLVPALLLTALVTGLLLMWLWPRADDPRGRAPDAAAAGRSGAAAAEARTIKATLFFVADAGTRLVPVESEVPFGEGTVEQARRILEAQLGDAPAPHATPVPAGTSLRAVFVTDRGEAFVDLSGEVTRAHPGGAAHELLTVYAIVSALAVNLPAITAVQILVDGREVDTLAGHVDLRRPLPASRAWLELPSDAAPGSPAPSPVARGPGTSEPLP